MAGHSIAFVAQRDGAEWEPRRHSHKCFFQAACQAGDRNARIPFTEGEIIDGTDPYVTW